MTTSKTNIVLITGANQGIGFETARALSKQHPDYHILLGSRNPTKGSEAASKLQSEGLSVEPVTIDISSDNSITEAFKTIDSKYGRLDVLINNAGIAIDERYIPGGSNRELMHEAYNTNVFGHIQTLETFIPLLQKAALPRVIFVSSSLGSFDRSERDVGRFAVYRSSKSALNMMVFTFAQQERFKGWKINITCPGYVATNLNKYKGRGAVESGTINTVRLATLGVDGETGKWTDKDGDVKW